MQVGLALDFMNFSLAGAREGFGPFLGVFLQSRGFDPAATGFAMSIAGASGLLATTPLGALVDRTERKRLALILAVLGIAIGAVLIVVTRSIWVIGAGQLLIGVADSSVAPIVAALTLGMVGTDAYSNRVARNEAFYHGGNAVNATLSGVLGYFFGLAYVALAIIIKSAMSIGSAAGINAQSIDHGSARGGEADERSTFRALLDNHRLLLLALGVLLFETANGAMLPFLAQARAAAGSNPSVTAGVMIVVSQITMIGASLSAAPLARKRNYAEVMTLSFVLVVARCVMAYYTHSWTMVIAVQVMEGLSMGLGGVAIPALVADIMSDTGHASAGLGTVMTAFGAGATLSPLLAGEVAQYFGFSSSFLALGAVAILGALIWIVGQRQTRINPPVDLTKDDGNTPSVLPAEGPAR